MLISSFTRNTDIEDSLQRLDELTQEEARMASAELIKVTHSVDDKVDQANRSLFRNTCSLFEYSDKFTGDRLKDSILRWLSPQDPFINHNIASEARHNGTSQWFFQGSIFNEWKSTGSFLWIHGKRASLFAPMILLP